MPKFIIPLIICAALSAPGQTDGPAALPLQTMLTPIALNPAPNTPKIIGPFDSLQIALSSATCGDVFLVDPTAVNTITSLPSLLCDAQHWIVISSSGPLPPEGTRIKPGTPMPKIIIPSVSTGNTIKGGAFVRLVGFEITRVANGKVVTSLVSPGNGAHDIIFDRVWIHGTTTDETVRGIQLSGATNVAVIDSYINDFHCASPGTCTDSQAIAGGLDGVQSGNYLIQNNYLEASGETILFGGGGSGFVPTDITVRWNDFNKPDSWNPLEPSYAPVNGKPWSVKNFFELKNGRRVLLEGNRMTGNWGGFSQGGFAIMLTPKNPNATCAVCAVEDVTVRYNSITKSGLAFQLAYVPSVPNDFPLSGARWSIHDNKFDRLQYDTCYGCSKWINQISTSVSPAGAVLQDVVVDHNTFLVDRVIQGGGFLILGGPIAPPMLTNISYTNNVQYAGTYPVFSTGGTDNCATVHEFKPDMWSACIAGVSSTMAGNVIYYTGTLPRGIPAGNVTVNAGAGIAPIGAALANRK